MAMDFDTEPMNDGWEFTTAELALAGEALAWDKARADEAILRALEQMSPDDAEALDTRLKFVGGVMRKGRVDLRAFILDDLWEAGYAVLCDADRQAPNLAALGLLESNPMTLAIAIADVLLRGVMPQAGWRELSVAMVLVSSAQIARAGLDAFCAVLPPLEAQLGAGG